MKNGLRFIGQLMHHLLALEYLCMINGRFDYHPTYHPKYSSWKKRKMEPIKRRVRVLRKRMIGFLYPALFKKHMEFIHSFYDQNPHDIDRFHFSHGKFEEVVQKHPNLFADLGPRFARRLMYRELSFNHYFWIETIQTCLPFTGMTKKELDDLAQKFLTNGISTESWFTESEGYCRYQSLFMALFLFRASYNVDGVKKAANMLFACPNTTSGQDWDVPLLAGIYAEFGEHDKMRLLVGIKEEFEQAGTFGADSSDAAFDESIRSRQRYLGLDPIIIPDKIRHAGNYGKGFPKAVAF
jgi:hypothetical protein